MRDKGEQNLKIHSRGQSSYYPQESESIRELLIAREHPIASALIIHGPMLEDEVPLCDSKQNVRVHELHFR